MTHTVFCKKLGKEEPGLDSPPFPGNLGEEIYKTISDKAWNMWLNHQTMLINEYRLNMLDAEARKFIMTEMQKYLFGEGSDTPPGFKPTDHENP